MRLAPLPMLAFCLAALAQNPGEPADPYAPRFVENHAWGPGERLVFSVEYGIIKAGTATLSVTGPEDYEGLMAYRITAEARSNPAFSAFFRVRDLNESLLDAVQFHTLLFHKSLEEGEYTHSESVIFDQEAGYAYYPDETDSTKMCSEILPHALDVLSCFYYARTMDFRIGDVFYIESHVDNENYPLRVTVDRRERIRVPAGEFECLLLRPEVVGEGIFDQQGELYVWVTDDEVHMPVLLRSAIVIGEITCLLEDYTPGTPLDIENPFAD
jgi:hypothetical protein